MFVTAYAKKHLSKRRAAILALVVSALSAALLSGVLWASSGVWDPDDVLEVAHLDVDREGALQAVAVRWPEPGMPVDVIQLVRDGTVVDTVSGFDDMAYDWSPIATTATYELWALSDRDELLGKLSGPTVLLSAPTTCTISWTGAASSDWGDSRNWAPVMVDPEGTVPGRTPDQFDDACIEARAQLPVTVSAGSQEAASLHAPAGVTEPVLRVDGGQLQVDGDFAVQRLVVAGGALRLPSGGTVNASAGVNLSLRGGLLALGGPLVVSNGTSGEVRVEGEDRIELQGGELVADVFRVGPPSTGVIVDADLRAADGFALRALTTTVNGNLDASVGSGGATLHTRTLDVYRNGGGGAARIGWQLSGEGAADEPQSIRVRDTSDLALTDLATLGPADTVVDSIFIRLEGPLRLAEEVTVLSGIRLDGADALLYSGGRDDVAFVGVEQIASITMFNASTLAVQGDLRTSYLFLDSSDLVVRGALTDLSGGPFLTLLVSGGTVEVGEPLALSDTFEVSGHVTVVGDVELNSFLGLSSGVPENPFTTLTIDGDLTLGENAFLLRDTGALTLSISGTLELAEGPVVSVGLNEPPAPGQPVLVIAAAEVRGKESSVALVGAGAAGSSVVFDSDGVKVRNIDDGDPVDPGEPGECAEALPSVLGVNLAGCWEHRGDGIFTAGVVASPDGTLPSIGGLTFDPAANAMVRLDVSDPTSPNVQSVLQVSPGTPGAVTVTVPIALGERSGRGGTAEEPSTGRAGGAGPVLTLADGPINWDLASSVSLAGIADLLGLPTPSGLGLTIANGRWNVDAGVRLPALFGAPVVPLSIPVGGRGIDPEDLSFSQLEGLVLGELAALADAGIEWVEDRTWALRSRVGDPFAVEGQLSFDGGLDAGTLTVSGLTVGGFGAPATSVELTWSRAAGTWSGLYELTSGERFAIEFATHANSLTSGSVELAGIDLGPVAIERIELDWAGDRWDVSGTARTADGSVSLSGTVVTDDGDLVQFDLSVEATLGPLGAFDPLLLSYDATATALPDGRPLPGDARFYALAATFRSGDDTQTVTGHLALRGTVIFDAALDVDLAIGALGAIEGTLSYAPTESPDWILAGRDGAADAVFTCGDAQVTASGRLRLSGGVPTSGRLATEGLCLGVAEATALELELVTGESGTLFDATITFPADDGTTVTAEGRVRMDEGRLVEGSLALPALTVSGLVEVPATAVAMSRDGDTERWLVEVDGDDALLRRLELAFTDGRVTTADVWLDPGSAAGPAASWGGWLTLESFRLTYEDDRGDGTSRWEVDGTFVEPAATLSGELDLLDGRVLGGSLDITGAEIGPLAQLDLTLTADTVLDRRFAIAATVTGDGWDGSISGSGELVFAGGQLDEGHLSIPTLPIGELVTVSKLEMAFEAGTSWSLSGEVRDEAGEIVNSLSGSAAFDDGRLTNAELRLAQLSLGPSSIEDLTFTLDRPANAPNRVGTYAVSGVVRAPITTEPGRDPDAGPPAPVEGQLTMVDGVISELNVTVPHLRFGDLAYLDGTSFAYVTDPEARTATLSGASTLTTAADTEPTAASVSVTFRAGRILDASVDAEGLPLAGLVTLSDLSASTSVTGLDTCLGLDAPVPQAGRPDLRVWAISATVGADATPVSGCVGIENGDLVAAQLALGTVQVADILRLEDLAITFDGTQEVELPSGDDTVTITRTALSLGARVTFDAGDPLVVGGSASLLDGGLETFELGLGRVPMIGGVELRQLTIAYSQTGRWDGESDTTFSLSGQALHSGGTTSVDGFFRFAPAGAGGRVLEVDIEVAELPIGPMVIDRFALRYVDDGTTTGWSVAGSVTVDGEAFSFTGDATVTGGRLVAASLSLPRLPIYDQLTLADLEFAYDLDTDTGAVRWFGAGSVDDGRAGRLPSAAIDVTLDAEGRLTSGLVTAEALAWGGLIELVDFELEATSGGTISTWSLAATVATGGGTPGSASGSLVLDRGQVTDGTIELTNVSIGGLATISEMTLDAQLAGGTSSWSGRATVVSGDSTFSGTADLAWSEGRLTTALVTLGTVTLSQSLTLEDVELGYPLDVGGLDGWGFGGSLVHTGGTSSLGGGLAFDEGALVGGAITAQNVQLGPLELVDFALVGGTSAPEVCGTTPADGDAVYALAATVGYGDGRTSSLGGFLTVTDGALVDAAACGSGIRLGELAVLDAVNLSYSDTDDEGRPGIEQWSGSATVRHSSGDDASASVSFSVSEGDVSAVAVNAAGIRLGGFLELQDVSFGYSGGDSTTDWALNARLARPGRQGSLVSGTLSVDRGVITAGSIGLANLPLGDVVTLRNVSIDYVGRRAAGTLPSQAESAPFALTGTSSCSATPSGFNVPTGAPTTAGAESYFSVSANVTYRGDTYAARGSLGFDDGRLSAFDVTAACLPIGDFIRLEDVRVALSAQGSFRLGGRLGLDNGTNSTLYGGLNFDGGRLTGGEIKVGGVPLGVTTIDLLELAVGQNTDGSSTWGAGLTILDSDGAPIGGSGSLTMNEGRITGGSLTIARLPLADLLDITDLGFSFTETPGGVALSGQGSVRRPLSSNPSTLSFGLELEDGRLVGGSLAASNVLFFNALPISSFSIGYSPTGGWTGSLGTALDNVPGAPSIVVGLSVNDGTIVDGAFGFDSTGNGQPDPPNSNGQAPMSGSGMLTAFPLKALYVSYCSEGSQAAFCTGQGPEWKGSIALEIPRPNPGGQPLGIAGSLTISNGRLVQAGLSASGLGLPIFTGVTLNGVGAEISQHPELRMSGSMDALVGPPGAPFMSLNGTIGFSEQPDWNPDLVAYEDYEAEWLQFFLLANAELFGMPVQAGGYIEIQTRGYVGMGGSISARPVKQIEIYGQVDAAVFDSGAIGATNPQTGLPMTGLGFQISAEIGARLFGRDAASAETLINHIGLGACGRVAVLGGVGGGFYWSAPLRTLRLRCNMGRYRIHEAVSVVGNSGRDGDLTRHEIAVGPDEPALGLMIVAEDALAAEDEGRLASRDVGGKVVDYALIAPDGTVYEDVTPENAEGLGHYLWRDDEVQIVLIENPAEGNWRLVQREDSLLAGKVESSLVIPDADVAATARPVAGDERKVAIDYDIARIKDQEVSFFERAADPDDKFMSPIGTVEASRDTEPRSARDIGPAAVGTLEFTPAGSSEASEREIVALVTQDGLPREEIVVGTFTAPAAELASAPLNVQVTETDGGAVVSWEPPADDGGRAILSYQIESTTGLSVGAEPDATEATLDIPAMWPDKEVPVIVRAYTGAGPGEPGVATFVATQSTGLQYLDGTVVPIDPVDPVDPVDPEGCEAGDGPFSDVGGTHPFCAEIEWLSDSGIATGYDDGTFRPTVAVSRQAMAAFLWRAAGSPAAGGGGSAFGDVAPGHPFYDAIQWMSATGLSTGTPVAGGGAAFKPTDPVSRQAMAAFLWRAAGSPDSGSGGGAGGSGGNGGGGNGAGAFFADVGLEHPFYDAIQWMGTSGLSTGTPSAGGALYKPVDPVSRQAMAAFLFRSSE